ncbi:hypothetical protein QJQ45_003024 [Haematococcus lacustris]|nr:hypothetical protein QJQ45_003024 [Haematococcus lacustris]
MQPATTPRQDHHRQHKQPHKQQHQQQQQQQQQAAALFAHLPALQQQQQQQQQPGLTSHGPHQQGRQQGTSSNASDGVADHSTTGHPNRATSSWLGNMASPQLGPTPPRAPSYLTLPGSLAQCGSPCHPEQGTCGGQEAQLHPGDALCSTKGPAAGYPAHPPIPHTPSHPPAPPSPHTPRPHTPSHPAAPPSPPLAAGVPPNMQSLRVWRMDLRGLLSGLSSPVVGQFEERGRGAPVRAGNTEVGQECAGHAGPGHFCGGVMPDLGHSCQSDGTPPPSPSRPMQLARPAGGESGCGPGSGVEESAPACAICMERQLDILLLPCKHDMCITCAYQLCLTSKPAPRCPFCMTAISGYAYQPAAKPCMTITAAGHASANLFAMRLPPTPGAASSNSSSSNASPDTTSIASTASGKTGGSSLFGLGPLRLASPSAPKPKCTAMR